MIARIDMNKRMKLTFFPKTRKQEIMQNVYCILTTVQGTVPCHRDMGLDNGFLHKPMHVAQAAYAATLADALYRLEPRAFISNITFDENASKTGRTEPIVEVRFLG